MPTEQNMDLFRSFSITNENEPNVQHVSWGPEGLKMSPEEQKAYLQKIIKQVEDEHKDVVTIPVTQLKDIYVTLLRINQLTKIDVRKWETYSKEILDLKHQIREHLDMALCFAGQWLPREVYKIASKNVNG